MRFRKSKAAGYDGKSTYDLKQLPNFSDPKFPYEMKITLIIITVSTLQDCKENGDVTVSGTVKTFCK